MEAMLARTPEVWSKKLDAQRAVQALERNRTNKRPEIFQARGAIDGQRDELIGKLEGQLKQRVVEAHLMTVCWSLI
jgi:hypothetical protein